MAARSATALVSLPLLAAGIVAYEHHEACSGGMQLLFVACTCMAVAIWLGFAVSLIGNVFDRNLNNDSSIKQWRLVDQHVALLLVLAMVLTSVWLDAAGGFTNIGTCADEGLWSGLVSVGTTAVSVATGGDFGPYAPNTSLSEGVVAVIAFFGQFHTFAVFAMGIGIALQTRRKGSAQCPPQPCARRYASAVATLVLAAATLVYVARMAWPLAHEHHHHHHHHHHRHHGGEDSDVEQHRLLWTTCVVIALNVMYAVSGMWAFGGAIVVACVPHVDGPLATVLVTLAALVQLWRAALIVASVFDDDSGDDDAVTLKSAVDTYMLYYFVVVAIVLHLQRFFVPGLLSNYPPGRSRITITPVLQTVATLFTGGDAGLYVVQTDFGELLFTFFGVSSALLFFTVTVGVTIYRGWLERTAPKHV